MMAAACRGIAALAAVLSVSRAAAAVVAQCEIMDRGVVTDGDGRVLAWNALHGGAAFVPVFVDSPAWALPALAADGVAFDVAGNPASPLACGAEWVSTVFLVVTPAPDAGRYSSLVEVPGASVTAAPHVVPRTYDPEDAAGISVRVNGSPSLEFPGAPHIVEVDFARPVPGADLRIGGESACAAWGQMWRGRVGAVIAFDAPPSETVRKVVRNMLSRRHGIAGGFPPVGQGAALQAAAQGLDMHNLFSTMLLLR
jgi:hypothetical protein